MSGDKLALAAVAALALAGLAKRRGSRSVDAEQLYNLVELYDTEDHREQAEELISTLGVEDWEKKAKHLRFLMRGRERMSTRSKVGFLKAPSGKLSQMLVDEYLRLIGYKSDRYRNFVRTTASGDMTKVKFTRNNMQLFGGRPGRWYKMSSTPYTTLAIEYLIKSARIVGDTQALEQLQAIKDKKAGAKKRASDRRFEKEYEKYAQDIAVIQATSVLRDELEDDLVSQTLSPQAIRRINEQAEKRKPAVLQRLKATGKRAEYAAPLARRTAPEPLPSRPSDTRMSAVRRGATFSRSLWASRSETSNSITGAPSRSRRRTSHLSGTRSVCRASLVCLFSSLAMYLGGITPSIPSDR